MLRLTELAGFGGETPTGFQWSISNDETNYDLEADLLARGWNGTDAITATVTIEAGVQINSNAVATPAFLIANVFPANMTINVINFGEITGKGGAADQAGGTAIKAATQTASPVVINIDNQGEINGGGGGGATGAAGANGNGVDPSGKNQNCDTPCVAPGGAGGAGGTGYGPGAPTSGSLGSSGSCCGSMPCTVACGAPGQNGGDGGAKGAQGGSGGGAGGNYIDGNANVIWINNGTRNGNAV